MATSWTTPKTWATGDVLTAGDMNTYVRDNSSWMGTDKPICSCYNSASISTTTSVWTSVTMDTENFDNQNLHSTSTNTSRFTIPAGMAGKYLLVGGIAWASAAGTARQHRFLVNGATVRFQTKVPVVSNTEAFHSVGIISLAATDFVELQGFQDSGGAVNMTYQADTAISGLHAVWMGT